MAEENEIDLEDPAIKAAIATAVEASVSGLKSKNTELLGKLKDSTTKLTHFETQFEGIDIDAVKGLLAKAGEDEETKLLTEGKIDEVFDKRTERLRGSFEKQLAEERTRAEKSEAFANKFRDKVLGDSIRAAAIKAGALPEATDDLILRARGQFTLNEDGEAVAVDQDGQAILGKDGKTPLTPLEWAESLRESAPHLWPRASGTYAPGGGSGKAAFKRSEMTAEQKRDYQRKHGQTAYLQLPK
ncbi:hypothetical protein ACI2KS_10660 [Pseudomonas sp. NPDC087358]|uniref:hypothetical protein n=1 Tax=Pseudomonas sp. NPDC087358 TaxID=3364439 RepID=UPI00384AE47A